MIHRFDKQLSRLEIYANGDELAQVMGMDRDERGRRISSYPEEKRMHVATLRDPVLVTDTYKIAQLDPATRDTVFALHGRSIRHTEYDGTRLRFDERRYKDVWGPSIDTLLFCRALENTDLSDVKKGIEVGCGSGFIAKYLLGNAPDLESMTLVDFNPYALICANENIEDERARYVSQDALEYFGDRKFDLIVCNPPYIPRPESIDDNPYEGIGLLSYLINNADKHLNKGGRIVTNISSLCEESAYRTIGEAGVRARVIDSLEVPLKVYNVLNNREWIGFLEERGLKKGYKRGYEYWQKLNITEISV